MFYVYCRSYYPVYEPAEGGYYVYASEVSECAEFNTLEDAYAEFIDSVAEAEKDGHVVSSASWNCGFKTVDGETYLDFPWVEYDKRVISAMGLCSLSVRINQKMSHMRDIANLWAWHGKSAIALE